MYDWITDCEVPNPKQTSQEERENLGDNRERRNEKERGEFLLNEHPSTTEAVFVVYSAYCKTPIVQEETVFNTSAHLAPKPPKMNMFLGILKSLSNFWTLLI